MISSQLSLAQGICGNILKSIKSTIVKLLLQESGWEMTEAFRVTSTQKAIF